MKTNLVVQGPWLTEAGAQQVARLAARSPERIAAMAFRFRNVSPSEVIASWSEKNRVDYAFVPEGRRFADLKLLAMDMDSTLITIECIDELGALAGKKAEVAAVTAQAMRGEIDYPESLRRRVAAIAGLPEAALHEIYEGRLGLTQGAEKLISASKQHGVKLLLVSGGFTFFTERLKTRLGIDYTISNTLEVREGKLTGALLGPIVDAEAKAGKFLEVVESLRARKEQTVAIGDGANDLKMMTKAGYSIAFRAKPVVRAQASCAINWCGLDAVVNLFEG
ncbi:MAG TPA: phosphoserine phosphatase SerB [Burkholderiales bacterium]|nr:phosphoserine phosphatase SerB [Burkholderiales bacterium]